VLDLNDEEWRIYARHEAHAPQYVSASAKVSNSTITEGCEIYGTVKNSVLGAGVVVEEGAVVADSVILENVTVKAGAEIRYAIIDSGTVVGENAKVGEDGAGTAAIAVVGADINVPDGKIIKAGAMISRASDLNEEVN